MKYEHFTTIYFSYFIMIYQKMVVLKSTQVIRCAPTVLTGAPIGEYERRDEIT